MINYSGKRVTATELAKLIIEDKGRVGGDYWSENCSLDFDKFTQREIEQVNAALDRQVERVQKLLGIYKIWDKVDSED